MAGEPGYTVDEARADAREWARDAPIGSRGWRACGRILDARIAELESYLGSGGENKLLTEHAAMKRRTTKLEAALRGLLALDVAGPVFDHLNMGIGTNTDDGRAWLAARDALSN